MSNSKNKMTKTEAKAAASEMLGKSISIGPCSLEKLQENLGVTSFKPSPFQPRTSIDIIDMLTQGGNIVNPVILWNAPDGAVYIMRGHRRIAYAETDPRGILLSAQVISGDLPEEVVMELTFDHGQEKNLSQREVYIAYTALYNRINPATGKLFSDSEITGKIFSSLEGAFGAFRKREAEIFEKFQTENNITNGMNALSNMEKYAWARFRRSAAGKVYHPQLQLFDHLSYMQDDIITAYFDKRDNNKKSARAITAAQLREFGPAFKRRIETLNAFVGKGVTLVTDVVKGIEAKIATEKNAKIAADLVDTVNWLSTWEGDELPLTGFAPGYRFADLDAKVDTALLENKSEEAGEAGEAEEAGEGKVKLPTAAETLKMFLGAKLPDAGKQEAAIVLLQYLTGNRTPENFEKFFGITPETATTAATPEA